MQRAHLLVFQPISMSLGGARDDKIILVWIVCMKVSVSCIQHLLQCTFVSIIKQVRDDATVFQNALQASPRVTQLTINWLSVVFLSSRWCVAKEVWCRLLWEAKTGGLLTHEEEGKWWDRMREEHPAIAPKENIQGCRFAAALVQVPLPKIEMAA
jgi:hypothetical protein